MILSSPSGFKSDQSGCDIWIICFALTAVRDWSTLHLSCPFSPNRRQQVIFFPDSFWIQILIGPDGFMKLMTSFVRKHGSHWIMPKPHKRNGIWFEILKKKKLLSKTFRNSEIDHWILKKTSYSFWVSLDVLSEGRTSSCAKSLQRRVHC